MHKQQSPSKNPRCKGIKAKQVLQICFLVVVCLWLIYQVKHSHDKRKEFNENDAKISVKLGRKDLHPLVEVTATSNEKIEDENEEEDQEENKHEEHEEEEEDQEPIVENEKDKYEEEEDKVEDENKSDEDFIDEEKEIDESSHEAREENYKADDASSAVTHGHEANISELENILKQEDMIANQNTIELDLEFSNKTSGNNDSFSNATANKEMGSGFSLLSNSTSVNSTEMNMESEDSTISESNSSISEAENEGEVQHDPIDSSDSSIGLEEKEVRTDLDTLPDIRTKGIENEDDASE